jgi:hypothetical protein
MVDMSGELVLDLLVRPESTLVDCNTKFSGLNADQVNNAENNLEQVDTFYLLAYHYPMLLN